MPLYYFKCGSCGAQVRQILKPEQAMAAMDCTCAGGTLERDPRPPSTQVVESLDNGAMPRRLERLADAERLFSERNDAVKKQQMGE